ncbi:DUF2809 domain-containing protein [Sphingomonas sp. Leaf25]|uniref:ribosomal maturation YjgA family protein n=1 Tax=Sphingomonas sp. Leaf25 TaxID=1735692 RepID=UPI0006F6B3AA|nr:DUF2809 domain-containing protein [Sphingomonas sp. Leaf25]KQN03875.1 hypothetical protein ASE78_02070 [Sphingomonas sp. Leaf25]
MRLHRGYALATIVLLIVEIGIALFVRDRIVRPYVGDTLAVILVYTGLRAVTRLSVPAAALTAFAIAVLIEFGQYFHVLDHIGLGENRLARTVLGSGFDLHDFIAYAAGALIAYAVDYRRASRAPAGTRTRRPSSDSSSTI